MLFVHHETRVSQVNSATLPGRRYQNASKKYNVISFRIFLQCEYFRAVSEDTRILTGRRKPVVRGLRDAVLFFLAVWEFNARGCLCPFR